MLFSEKISELERVNTALVTQVEEVTAQQIDRDKVIDEFGAAIDTRINEWKVHAALNEINLFPYRISFDGSCHN